jgi:CHRD domain
MLKIGAVMLIALALSGLALAAARDEEYTHVANMKATSEVPKPAGVPANATGLFKATSVERSNGSVRLTWRLTFSHLTGSALASHIHLGKPGKAGPVAITLCGPCKNGQRGVSKPTKAQFKAIESGGAYVNIHTKKNAAGEIRGQIKTSS